MTEIPRWDSYLAMGDSFTEGLWDVLGTDGRPDPEMSTWCTEHPDEQPARRAPLRGWADILATQLARRRGPGHEFRYANLAIRGRLIGPIIEEQLPVALEAKPALVSLVGGGNDLIRPAVDLDGVTDQLEAAVAALREAGIDVLLSSGFDARSSGLVSATRRRAGIFTANLWSIARRHGAYIMDPWGMRSLQDERLWSADRIHLLADGHRRVAQAALVALGLEPDDPNWDDPLVPLPSRPTLEQLGVEASWVRQHAYPWATRRFRRTSTGHDRRPKLPDFIVIPPDVPAPGLPASASPTTDEAS